MNRQSITFAAILIIAALLILPARGPFHRYFFGAPKASVPAATLKSRAATDFSAGNYKQASDDLKDLVNSYPNDSESIPLLESQAKELRQKGQYQLAIDQYNLLASTYPRTTNAPEALYAVSQIYAYDLHGDQHEYNALQALNKLIKQYHDANYPDKANVDAERLAVARTLDYFYAHSDRAQAYGLYIPYKYLYGLMNFFVNLTGARSYSYWIALLLISVIVRLGLTPLTLKQYKSMREMQRLQPLMKELQAKYKDDKQVLTQRTMDLYREHNVNPAAGCVPMLIQLPVFSAMYMAVRVYQYHFTHGTFLWIGSGLSHHFPQFLAPNLGEQDIPLLFLYSVSMYVTQRMMPATDPSQAEMQRTTALMMSVFFFIFFQSYGFPSAFVLYWLISNILSTGTQLYFMRRGTIAPAGATVFLPSDGDPNAKSKKNGGSNGQWYGSQSNGSNANGAGDPSAPGTAKGIMAPKIHPKKKKR